VTAAPHVLIVGAAPEPGRRTHYASVIATADVVIAADRGLHLCLEAGRVPDVCVGDFDSVDEARLEEARSAGARIVRYPAEKDASDLDLALEEARAIGAGRVTFTAAYSARIDHTLAALGTLLRSADLRGTADEPSMAMHALQAGGDRLSLRAQPGTTISVFALGGCATVTLEGVLYPLNEHVLDPLSSFGLSNVATAREQVVTVLDGQLLVTVWRERT
jgi:thiamine pyrophosphokinase